VSADVICPTCGQLIPKPGGLTPRQLETLLLAAQGYENKQIAKQFGNSETTATHTFTRVMRKLGASDRAHAVALALYHGILTKEDLGFDDTIHPKVVTEEY
jgi:DNA-binding NarL/FixJ family response regulator